MDKLELLKDFSIHIKKKIISLIFENLNMFGIELKYLCDLGYDGVAVMSGKYKYVQVHIKKLYSFVIYVHTSAYLF